MKKYVFVSVAIGIVGGGQMYIKNKAQYMEKMGYEVYVLYFYYHKEITIKYLERFREGYFPDLELNFLCLSHRRRNGNLTKILKYINYNSEDEVIVECNSVLPSLWGEEIAKRTNGKNIIFSLDEKNRVSEPLIEYLDFKYLRKELSGIKTEFFTELYKKSKVVPDNGVTKLIAFLGDPVEDYEEPAINNLELKEKNICILGRMRKHYVLYSCKELVKYVAEYPEVDFTVTIIGSAEKNVLAQINTMFQSCTNVSLNILDAMHPMPKKIFSMFDLIIGGAGCASLSYRQGALTLCVDVREDKASGFMGYDVFSSLEKKTDTKEFGFYLDEALFTKKYKERKCDVQKYTTEEECFASHINFVKDSEAEKAYFSFENSNFPPKEHIVTFLRAAFGAKNIRKLHSLFTRAKRFMQKILK